MAEEALKIPTATELADADKQWEDLDAGLKARAMRTLHEEQQKLVVELGRNIMEKQTEIAVAVAKAKAVSDMGRGDLKTEIVDSELTPRHRELAELVTRMKVERDLLDTYEKLGKGIIT